jgi:hypothetical protein
VKGKDRISSYALPNTKAWFESAYMSSRDDATGRENIWNYAWKSSLYGEFSFNDSQRKNYLAPFMNITFAFLFVLMCYGLPLFWRRRRAPYLLCASDISPAGQPHIRFSREQANKNALRRHSRKFGRTLSVLRADAGQHDFRFVLTVTAVFLLFFMLIRYNSAIPSFCDFRYIMSLMPVFVAAAAGGLMRLQGVHRWLFIAANVLVLSFASASLLFYFGI